MAKYEVLPTTIIHRNDTMLHSQKLPELVHLEDPAISVMTDFHYTVPHTIQPYDTMDHAIREMEASGVHLLLVMNADGHFQGILSSEDVWGEKPIQLLQERRIPREQILAHMIMVPYTNITAINFDTMESARVGNIVKTLTAHKQHYALVIKPCPEKHVQIICGIFTASQISKQLHQDIADIF